MHPWLPLASLLFLTGESAPAPHKIDVRIMGPVALVEVWRTVEAGSKTDGNRQVATYVDLSLPDKATLLDWEIVGGHRERVRMTQQTDVQVSSALVAALKFRGLSLATSPSDESARHRIHLVPLAERDQATLHYRFTAPVACQDGRFVIHMPESLEESPVPAEVTVTLEPVSDGMTIASASVAAQTATVRPRSRRLVMQAMAPARSAWDIAWSFAESSGGLPGHALVAVAPTKVSRVVKGKQREVPGDDVVGAFCRSAQPSSPRVPRQALFLIDRSRSVGPGGISAERALAKALAEALPPSVPFNAVLFGQKAEMLFAWPRMPTREALDALVNAADPNRLENGTDVAAALASAAGLLELGASDDKAPAWVILITDGALPPDQAHERMQAALAKAKGRAPHVLVLVVRQTGDDDVPPAALAEYAKLARRFGGMLRIVPQGSAAEVARAMVADMAKGGDALDVKIEDVRLADVVSPAKGAEATFTLAARPSRFTFTLRTLDAERTASVRPVPVPTEWLAPMRAAASAKRAWTGATQGMAVAVVPATPAARATVDTTVRGRMDPLVLRNALSLAFLPRARACYLSRRFAKPSDAYLRGRMKLELTLERGELHGARVLSSTLDNPTIESCVRDAAWAIDYPRPEHRDAPTVANLNLVFQPRTAEERRPDASAVDHDIELILGPMTFSSDYSDLLENAAKVPPPSSR